MADVSKIIDAQNAYQLKLVDNGDGTYSVAVADRSSNAGVKVAPTITVDTAAYATGDDIGGIITLSSVMSAARPQGQADLT